MIGAITVYPFVVTYLVPSKAQQGELTSLFGWSWQTWLIIFLVSIILTLLIQNWIEKYDKDTSTLSASTSANNGSIAIQRAENSPVVQASSGGFASAGNIHLTQNFFPPTILQSISTSVSGGRIEVRHIPDNSSFKFAVLNDTNSDLRNCVVYIDEIAYKSDEDKSWNRLDDLPSEKPLRWITTVLPTIDGSYDIDAGKRLSFVMINKSSKYFLEFFKENVLLPYSNVRSHRILIRFDGKFLLSGRVTNKFYVYFYEEILGQKIYYGIEEYQEGQ